jgi:hypothetical protein
LQRNNSGRNSFTRGRSAADKKYHRAKSNDPKSQICIDLDPRVNLHDLQAEIRIMQEKRRDKATGGGEGPGGGSSESSSSGADTDEDGRFQSLVALLNQLLTVR